MGGMKLGIGAAWMVRAGGPRATVRWRLTLLYGGLFLVCGAALLAITYTLVAHATVPPRFYNTSLSGPGASARSPSRPGVRSRQAGPAPAGIAQLVRSLPGRTVVHVELIDQRISDLHQLQLWSAIALAIMAVVSAALGWVVAGRVLAPLRMITATTQQISDSDLHRRLALAGPRDELRQLADTIDALLERLEGAFEAQRRFVANASHELRTPLAMMRTFLDVATGKPEGVPPQTRALNARLREALDQADRLLESFLVLARAQHGELGEQGSVALEQVVAAALEARTKQIADKQIEVHTALYPVCVAGSETLLARMVDNVVENAVRHSPSGGLIDIALALDGENAQLTIDNSGAVLDEHAVAELAQPFRRLGQERTGSQNGHGLGISIVAAIADAHDGTLKLRARPQGGLRVQISLRSAISYSAGGSDRMRILVVEDVPAFANAIAEGLRDQGMAVDVAYDGHEAAAKLNLNPYDVVVLDRDLPGIHGDTICHTITKSDDAAMVLMLTAADSPNDRVAGLALGADDYLPKPFHFPELVLRVRALARRKPTAHRHTLQAAGIELDPAHRHRHPRRPSDRSNRQGTRRPRSPAQRQPRRADRGKTTPAGVGRKHRSIHEHSEGHHRQTQTKARRTADHPPHPRNRLSNHDHRSAKGALTAASPEPAAQGRNEHHRRA